MILSTSLKIIQYIEPYKNISISLCRKATLKVGIVKLLLVGLYIDVERNNAVNA